MRQAQNMRQAHLVPSIHQQNEHKCEVNYIGSQTTWGKPVKEDKRLKQQIHQIQAGYLIPIFVGISYR